MPNQLWGSSAFNEFNGFQQICSVYRGREEEKKLLPSFLPNTKHVSLKAKPISFWFMRYKGASSEVRTCLQILLTMTHKPEENPAHSSGPVLTLQLTEILRTHYHHTSKQA